MTPPANSVESLQARLGPVLAPLGWLYGRVMAARAALYASGGFPSYAPAAPTVSVGNIGWGGSGKTPLAGWLLEWGVDQGLSPVLLTRGYRAKPPHLPYTVTPDSPVEQAGDEPLLLARQVPGAVVLVDPVRKRAAAQAERELHPGLVVLDDGFQHLAVRRDLDLVLLRPRDLGPAWGKVNPVGTWRESVRALERASAFFIKAPPERFTALVDQARKRLGRYGKPIFFLSLDPTGLRSLHTGQERADLGGEPYLLVSAVAGPEQVAATAQALLGQAPLEYLTFPDHHAFTSDEVADMRARAAKLGARHLLCTAKDAVKLAPLAASMESSGVEFHSLEVRPVFAPCPICNVEFPSWWASSFTAKRWTKDKP